MKNIFKFLKENLLNKSKFKYGSASVAFTAVVIAIVIAINVVFSSLTTKFPSLDIDMTSEKLNTLSETAEEVAEDVTQETVIYFIGTEDEVKSNLYYSSYGFQYSTVAALAEKMAAANSYISVVYIDPDLQPEFISAYASESLETSMVLVETEARYSVLSVNDLFTIETDDYGNETTYSTADGALANAVYIVNLETVPVIAVATGHDELFTTDYRYTFDSLMEDNGFQVVEFDIMTEEVPEEAQIIMISTPSTDYSVEEIAKIEAFLDDTSTDRALFVTAMPTQGDLPNLEAFLEEWGIAIGEGTVFESDSSRAMTNTPNMFLVDINTEIIEEEYSRIISYSSSPIEILFSANNDIVTYPLLSTLDSAYVVTGTDDDTDDIETDTYNTAVLSRRLNNVGNNTTTYTNVIVMGDTYSLYYDFLSSSAFSNREVIVDVLQTATAIEDASVSLYVEQTETNILDITATWAVIQTVGLTICTIAIPLLILVAGLVIFLKRRHL